MADTRVQREVENWVRDHWMAKESGQKFHRGPVRLTSGGKYDFDAVSEDGQTVAAISTSGAQTSSGKTGMGKLLKIRSDMYFLLLTDCRERLLVLTERDMYELCQKEKANGRVPQSIQFRLAGIPNELADRLKQSRIVASMEVAPSR